MGPLSRRQAFTALAPAILRGAPSRPPNILLILMDDMASRSLSCYGNPYVQTPHLDRLALQGMRFTQAYVTPQCTPTRATLMTGQYTARNRMWHVIPWYGSPWSRVTEPPYLENISRDTYLLPKGLKQRGYATACLGKWHLTANADGNYNQLLPQGAPHYGFDEGLPAIPRDTMGYDRAVDHLTSAAISFIERNRQRPFFCYLSHHAIHRVLAAPPALVQKYRDKGFPDAGLNKSLLLASLEHMDAGIGRVLSSLDDLKLTENTLVMFLTDNGGIHRTFQPKPARDDSGAWRLLPGDPEFDSTPLREGKGFAYEGGIRVPMIVRWPGQVKPGQVSETPVHAVDILPTFLDAAGTRAPQNHPVDGVSLLPLLRGKGKPPKRPLYWYMPLYDLRWAATPSAIVRDGDWKLIEYFGDSFDLNNNATYRPGNRLELYDLARDPSETTDLAPKMPAKVKALQQQLHAWLRSAGAVIPAANPQYDPARELAETNRKATP